MRKRLSYANVTATLALVFAMSGGAMAANHYLITSTKQINPKVLKKLTGKPGKNGTAGATGATGQLGAGQVWPVKRPGGSRSKKAQGARRAAGLPGQRSKAPTLWATSGAWKNVASGDMTLKVDRGAYCIHAVAAFTPRSDARASVIDRELLTAPNGSNGPGTVGCTTSNNNNTLYVQTNEDNTPVKHTACLRCTGVPTDNDQLAEVSS